MPSSSSLNVPGADESCVHVVAVGERVAREQLQVAQVRRVRRTAEARVVGAVLWIGSFGFSIFSTHLQGSCLGLVRFLEPESQGAGSFADFGRNPLGIGIVI